MGSEEYDENEESPTRRAVAWTGSLLLFGGAAFVFVLVISRFDPTIRLPRFLFVNRSLWLLTGAGVMVAGMACIKGSTAQLSGPRSPFARLVLYTRQDCGLCDEARDLLDNYSHLLPPREEVDVDADAELQARFNECVPVVEIDGRVRFRGRINEVLLKRMIRGAQAQAEPSEPGAPQ